MAFPMVFPSIVKTPETVETQLIISVSNFKLNFIKLHKLLNYKLIKLIQFDMLSISALV